ncbi:substrate-binding periplasmic protein [Shewanella gaetbuli]
MDKQGWQLKPLVNIMLFVIMLALPGASWAEVVLKYNMNASSSWMPYYIPNSPQRPGILGEILPQIIALADLKAEKHNYPPKRTNQALETGLLDFDIVSPSWFPHGDMGELFVQSKAIIDIQESIIVLPKNTSKWSDIDKIKGQKIGTIRGYLYHDDHLYTRVDFLSERELVRALHKQRIEVAISGDLPALYWAKQLNLDISLAAIHSKGVLVMRLRKEHQHLMPKIDAAIDTLTADGTVQRIIDKYTNQEVFKLNAQ